MRMLAYLQWYLPPCHPVAPHSMSLKTTTLSRGEAAGVASAVSYVFLCSCHPKAPDQRPESRRGILATPTKLNKPVIFEAGATVRTESIKPHG